MSAADEGVDCRLDDRLEDPAGEVKAADEAGDALLARKPLRVAQARSRLPHASSQRR